MNCEIQNWKELKAKFGLDDAKKCERRPYSARQISSALYNKVRESKEPIKDGVLVPCGEFSELDCIFKLVECVNNKYLFSFDGVVG